MPRWLGRLVWIFRRNRLVRLHCVAPIAGSTAEVTIEGFLVGRWWGHYVLERAKLLEADDGTSQPLGKVEIPCDRVWFRQVIEKDARL